MDNISYKLIPQIYSDHTDLINESASSFMPSKEDPTFDVYKFIESRSSEDGFQFFVLVINENIVGYITNFGGEKDTTLIGPMYISSKFQGKGYGKIQVRLFINWSKKNGYKRIKTRTWGSNIGSNKIFQSLGFNESSRIENDRIDGSDTVKYLLDLEV